MRTAFQIGFAAHTCFFICSLVIARLCELGCGRGPAGDEGNVEQRQPCANAIVVGVGGTGFFVYFRCHQDELSPRLLRLPEILAVAGRSPPSRYNEPESS